MIYSCFLPNKAIKTKTTLQSFSLHFIKKTTQSSPIRRDPTHSILSAAVRYPSNNRQTSFLHSSPPPHPVSQPHIAHRTPHTKHSQSTNSLLHSPINTPLISPHSITITIILKPSLHSHKEGICISLQILEVGAEIVGDVGLRGLVCLFEPALAI